MTQRHTAGVARTREAGTARLASGLLALALAACNTSSLVDLQNPDIISGGVAQDTTNITSLRNGAQYEFARALAGTGANNLTPGIVGISGVMSDELWYASTFTGMQDIDRRTITPDNSDLLRVYQYMHRARNTAEQAAQQYTTTSQNNSADQAMLVNRAGYIYLMFAENFCSGVPFSQTSLSAELTYGPPLTTAQMLDSALARFDRALAIATTAGSSQEQNLARVGRARVFLDRGDFANASAAAATVPATGFTYNIVYSENTSGQNNGVFYNINSEARTSAASGEGVNGIDFFRRGSRTAGGATTNTTDPRTPADSAGRGLGTQLPLYVQLKYPTLGSPIPLASSTEAQLIQAEVAMNKGASAAYLPTVNALRATYQLAPLTDPGTPQARVRQFFRERAFFLWLTGHRLSDLRRLVRQYGFTQDQVFPTTQTIAGTPYGTDVNFPIPQQEQNNPQFPSGTCIDRAP